jgi:ankyrin repeat protein
MTMNEQMDLNGNTLLHHAACGTNTGLLRAVLTDGYDINVRNQKGETPLHIAYKHGRLENVFELARHRADPGIRDNAGNRPHDLDTSGI